MGSDLLEVEFSTGNCYVGVWVDERSEAESFPCFFSFAVTQQKARFGKTALKS